MRTLTTVLFLLLILFVFGCNLDSVITPDYKLNIVSSFEKVTDTLPPVREYNVIRQYDFTWIADSVHATHSAIVKMKSAHIVGWSMSRDKDYLFICNITDGMPCPDSAVINIDPIIEKVDSLHHYFSFNVNFKHVPFVVRANELSDKVWYIEKRIMPVHPIWGYPFKNSNYHLSVWVDGFVSEPIVKIVN